MEIIFKVKNDFISVRACDICGKCEVPENGTEVARQSTLSSGGGGPFYYVCKKCGKDKSDNEVTK